MSLFHKLASFGAVSMALSIALPIGAYADQKAVCSNTLTWNIDSNFTIEAQTWSNIAVHENEKMVRLNGSCMAILREVATQAEALIARNPLTARRHATTPAHLTLGLGRGENEDGTTKRAANTLAYAKGGWTPCSGGETFDPTDFSCSYPSYRGPETYYPSAPYIVHAFPALSDPAISKVICITPPVEHDGIKNFADNLPIGAWKAVLEEKGDDGLQMITTDIGASPACQRPREI